MVETRSGMSAKKITQRNGTKPGRKNETMKNFHPPPVMVTPRKESPSDEGSKKRKAMTPEEEPPRTRAKVDDPAVRWTSWSDRSNVGNLSIREKLFLSVIIFSSLSLAWAIYFSVSVCGTVEPPTSTPGYTKDLTLCKTTWSTLGWLADSVLDGQELSSLRLESRSIHEQIHLYEKTNSILQDSFKQVNSTLHAQIQILQQSLEAEKRQVRDLTAELTERDVKMKKLIVSMGKMDREREQSISIASEMRNKCAADEKKIMAISQDLNAEKERLSKELTVAVQERDKIQQELIELRMEMGSPQDVYMQVSPEESETLKKALSELQAKYMDLETETAKKHMLSKDLAMAKRDHADTTRRLVELRQKYETEQNSTKQLTKQLESTRAMIQKVEEQHEADRNADREIMKQLSDERDNIKARLFSTMASMKQLEEQHEANQNDQHELVKRISAERDAIKAQLESTRASMHKLKEHHNANLSARHNVTPEGSGESDLAKVNQPKINADETSGSSLKTKDEMPKYTSENKQKKKRQNLFRRLFNWKGRRRGEEHDYATQQ